MTGITLIVMEFTLINMGIIYIFITLNQLFHQRAKNVSPYSHIVFYFLY